MPDPAWLPELVEIAQFGGDHDSYLKAVRQLFDRDFRTSSPSLDGVRVGVSSRQPSNESDSTFWHCASEDCGDSQRVPDFNRCSRIEWIRAIIEHSDDASVSRWENTRKGRCILLWFNEEYLVVIGVRRTHLVLITAYPTPSEKRKRKLRAERDGWNATNPKKADAARVEADGIHTPSALGR